MKGTIVDRDRMVEGVRIFQKEYNRGVPLGQAIRKWSEMFGVKEETVKKHLRQEKRLRCNSTHIYLKGDE